MKRRLDLLPVKNRRRYQVLEDVKERSFQNQCPRSCIFALRRRLSSKQKQNPGHDPAKYTYNNGQLSTPQRVFVLFSKHCPSQGRKDGPCWESRAVLGRQQCRHRLGDESGQQPVLILAIAFNSIRKGSYMLVDQDNCNVLPLAGVPIERTLDS